MKVLFCYRVQPFVQEYYLRKLPEDFELIFPQKSDEQTLISLITDVDAVVASKVSEKELLAAKKLKHIQVPWTGSETLDFNLLKEFPHITVSNSHSNALVIAEHAVALLIASAKRIIRSDRMMRKGDWSSRYDEENSFYLNQKSLGILGLGSIGKIVAKMMKSAFEMKILAIKRFPERTDSETLCDYIGGQNKKDLEYVLKNSDYILISLPLTEETKDLIGEEELNLMKPTAILINIARGPIINEKALYETLKHKKIAAAGLDAWYNYPKNRKNPVNVFQNYPFRELDNVILSPHRAFKVHQRADIVTAKDVIDNLVLISKGEKPKNQLNMDLGY